MADLIALGVTTPYDQGGLTAFDKLAGWAYDKDGENLHDFDADDAMVIVERLERLCDDVERSGS